MIRVLNDHSQNNFFFDGHDVTLGSQRPTLSIKPRFYVQWTVGLKIKIGHLTRLDIWPSTKSPGHMPHASVPETVHHSRTDSIGGHSTFYLYLLH